jgi:uncharacterized protein (UPF0264 family)
VVEAQAAVAGGAAIIDVKEPSQGPLGRAPCAAWSAVRDVVPEPIPVSVALGELNEWCGGEPPMVPAAAWRGIVFCKLGLAHAPSNWRNAWRALRGRLHESTFPSPAWVAVVYIDWQPARAPDPDGVIGEAAEIDECRGVLFDTWDKTRRSLLDATWKPRIARVQALGRFVALAGSLDTEAIVQLAALQPDIFAVRGAACRGGDRHASIEPNRVARLAAAAEKGDKSNFQKRG